MVAADDADAIDAYVEALSRRLDGSTIQVHRTLLEIEDHLRESQASLVASGVDANVAADEAVANFGSVAAVAAGLNGHVGSVTGWARARGLLATAAQLGAAVFIVAAVGGSIAAAAAAVLSKQAIFGFPSRATASAADCAHGLAVQPTAVGCQQARTFEAASDLTMYLGAFGIIGLIVLAVVWGLKRARVVPSHVEPPSLAPAVATCGFLATGVALLALALGSAVVTQTGARGLWLCEAICAFAAAAVSAVLWRRAIRRPAERRA
jgi:hypothetical protein